MISPTLQALLARLDPNVPLDLGRFQDALLAVRYTGPVTYDYLNGVAQQINLGQPVKLAICRRTNGALDTGKGSKSP